MQSILFQNASTLDKNNRRIDKSLKMDTLIYQVIGSKDEIWETDLTQHKNRLPDIKQYIVKGEKHKGVVLRSSLFYDGLLNIYRQQACSPLFKNSTAAIGAEVRAHKIKEHIVKRDDEMLFAKGSYGKQAQGLARRTSQHYAERSRGIN